MARTRPQGAIRQRTKTRIFDESGQEIYATEYSSETIQDPQDGSVSTVKEAENTTLTTAESYNIGMSVGPKPVLRTGVCNLCRTARPRFLWSRRRVTHGLTNVLRLNACTECGLPACPRCRRQSPYDRKWRCLKHHRLHKWMMRLQAIFFEEENG